MHLHERHRFATPEGIHLDAEIAGLGSRVLAGMLDLALAIAITAICAGLSAAFIRYLDAKWAGAVLRAALLIPMVGYSVIFETLWDGRTPGKRALRLQAVRTDGAPMDVGTAFLRSFIRLVESAVGLFIVPIVMLFADPQHQRLGDLVAGTVVVRDRQAFGHASVLTTAAYDDAAPFRKWDVYSITPFELATVRRFLDRRSTLRPAARTQLGIALWSTLKPKVAGAPSDWNPEAFLESLVAARTAQGLG
ncbi:MAG: RDD family protein [Acidimicrobiia bacterium]